MMNICLAHLLKDYYNLSSKNVFLDHIKKIKDAISSNQIEVDPEFDRFLKENFNDLLA